MIWETKAMLHDEIRKLNNTISYLEFINRDLGKQLDSALRQIKSTEDFLAVLAAEQVPES